MAIDSVFNPAGIAERLSVQQLQQAIQSGSIPPYIGIPMLEQKVQMEQRMRNASAQTQQGQPSIAEEVMSKAEGLNQLQSNLPEQYAGGGIVAFARGGIPDIEGDQFDEDSEDEMNDEIRKIMRQMQGMRDMALRQSEEVGASPEVSTLTSSSNIPSFTSTEVKKGVSVKEGDQPARTVEERQKSVTKPAGLEELLSMIEQKESGGRRYDKAGNLLTSPKGAMGEMQVMPMTARDPGFGIRPAEGNNPDEYRRVGREYYAKMLEKYGDPKLAAIAYNMGPGATDKWLMAGADPSRLPDETRKYAQGFAEGGIASIKRFQYGGISGTMPYSLSNISMEDLARMARMGEPGAAEELMRRRATAPSGNLFDRIFGQSPEEMRSAAERRLRMEQARGAFSGAQPAASAAPAEPVSSMQQPARLGPTATQQQPSTFSRLFGRGLLGPSVPVIGGGAAATGLAGGILGGASDEGLAQLSSDIGSDTGLAAAIMAEGRKTPPAAPVSPVSVAKPPATTRPSAPVRSTGLPMSVQDPFGYEDQGIGALVPEYSDSDMAERADRMTGGITPESVAKAVEIAPESEFLKRLQDRISKGYAKLDKQEETDKYLALLSAGLGIMSGTSPFALSNIGRGGMMGVQSLMQSDASRAAQEAKLMNAELLAERIKSSGETAKELRLSREQTARELEQGRMDRARLADTSKAEGRVLRAAEFARRMENDYITNATAKAKEIIKNSMDLKFDEAKAKAFIEEAELAARRKLNLNPTYRKYVRESTEGYDPGELDLTTELNEIVARNLKKQK